ncbi:FAS1-like dehydratase domain-containing protein [Microtetraspora malaysiensis]|uniref:FAS1-like dehydratase domain-containing protein n=1 Tax=Microtetraspora malaysiensis TaxID=161358 RepID=UPI003D8AC1C3
MSGLLTDEIRAMVGQEAVYTAPEPLGRAALRYYALAVGDDNPLYRDSAYAASHGYRDVVAPPTLICETNQYAGLARDDDGYAGHSWRIDVPGARLVRGGNDYTFHQPVHPDDVITATWRIESVTEKAGKLFVVSRAVYTNQHDELLATNEETLIYVGAI